MENPKKDTLKELQRIEQESRVLELLSDRLNLMEQQMNKLSSQPSESSPIIQGDLQEIISKMSILRDLIDKIEIEIDQLDSRITDIESLRFKHRTDV